MDKPHQLQQIKAQIKECSRCPLRETATRPVPGLGNPDAKYILIGEAPGSNEDKAGIPFVGQAGKRLNQLIELGKIDINQCYLTNVCRCRPPGNRQPRKPEVKACVDYLWQEIRIIRPSTIITLGATPLKLFSDSGVSQLHGSMFEFEVKD